MSLGGPPLKMRLKKSCKSAGLVGLGALSEGVLKRESGKVQRYFVLEPQGEMMVFSAFIDI